MRSLETLFQSATPIDFQREKILFLNKNSTLYRVKTGTLEVYFSTINAHKQRSKGYHFATLQEGDLLCDLPYDETLCFYAFGNAQTQLLSIPQETFVTQVVHEETSHDLLKGFHAWIKRFHGFLTASLLSPKQCLPLETNTTTTEPSMLRLDEETVRWIELFEGEALVCEQEALRLSADQTLFAMSAMLWLQTDVPCHYALYTTEELLQQGRLLEALEDFYRHVTKAFGLYIADKMAQEERKLRERTHQDEHQITHAILSLAGVIDHSVHQPLFTETLNPYLAACKIVGDVLQVTIHDHPDLKKKSAVAANPIKKIAKASGVKVRDVLLIGEWYKSDHGPLIGYLNHEGEKHVVALLPAKKSAYEMVHPTSGIRVLVDETVAASLENFAHMLYKPLPNRVLKMKDIYQLILFGTRQDLKMILSMGVLVGLLGMLTPIFTGKIFDTIVPESNYFQLTQIGIALLSIALGSTLFNVAKGLAVTRAQGQVSLHLQSAIWDRLLSLPAPFFREYNTGDLAMRANGINLIQEMLSGTLMSTLLSGIFSFFSLVLLFYYSAKLALIALVLVVIAMLFSFYSAYVQVQYQRQIVEKNGEITGFILQLLTGIQKIRAAGAEKRAFAQWAKRYAEQRNISFKAGNSENYLEVFNDVFPTLTSIVIFASVVYLMQADTKFTTGSFIAFNAAFGQFLSSSLAMSGVLIGVLNIVPIYKRIEPIFTNVPEVDTIKSDPGELSGAIEVSNLKFKYPKGENEILKGVSFTIQPGQFVAFVGPSGSGKSTVFRLLLGFEKPKSGSIFYDKQNLAELDIQAVRSQIGTVLQNGQIIQGDIFNNIVGATGMSLEDAWSAAAMAGFDEDVRQMPMGMHTAVSSGGGTLSGGQRQRLLIARALITKPRIVLFDEATSALDNRTQSIVTKSLEKLQATRIVIAHRLSTIQNADYIYVIDEGNIVEHGTYASLVEHDGLFKKLALRQLS